MATSVNLNGVSYNIPSVGETDWGSDLTAFLVAIPSGVLQKTGGSFTLTNDVDFGASKGLITAYIKSKSASTASAGVFRLGNAELISWRNAANSGDLSLRVNASNALQFNSVNVLLAGAGAIVNADISNSAAIAYSKLALSGSIVDADISNSAAIARSKVAGGSASHVVINDGSGNLSSEAQLSISRGGTGQSSAGAALNALSPSTTKGDILVYNGSSHVRLPVGTNNQVLTADSAESSGLKWGNSAVADNSITEAKLTTSVAGDGLDGGNGTPLSVNVDDSTIEINADTLRIKDSGVTESKIDDSAVTTAKIDDGAVTRAKLEAVGASTSSSCGAFTTSSTSFVDVTNLSVSKTTTGRPVKIMLIADGNGSSNDSFVQAFATGGNANVRFRIMRGSTEIALFNLSTNGTNSTIPSTFICHEDDVPAGTYTYKVQARDTVGSSSSASVYYSKLRVREL